MLGLRCCAQASLVAMHELLIVLAPLAVEHELSSAISAGVACGLNCPVAYGIFPDQGLNLHPLQ